MDESKEPETNYDLPHEDAVFAILKKYGVTRAQLFGSAARGELQDTSDINLLVDIDGPTNYGLLFRLTDELEQLTGRDVDIIVDVDPLFKPYIEDELVELPL